MSEDSNPKESVSLTTKVTTTIITTTEKEMDSDNIIHLNPLSTKHSETQNTKDGNRIFDSLNLINTNENNNKDKNDTSTRNIEIMNHKNVETLKLIHHHHDDNDDNNNNSMKLECSESIIDDDIDPDHNSMNSINSINSINSMNSMNSINNDKQNNDENSIVEEEEYINDPHYTHCFNYDENDDSMMMFTQQQFDDDGDFGGDDSDGNNSIHRGHDGTVTNNNYEEEEEFGFEEEKKEEEDDDDDNGVGVDDDDDNDDVEMAKTIEVGKESRTATKSILEQLHNHLDHDHQHQHQHHHGSGLTEDSSTNDIDENDDNPNEEDDNNDKIDHDPPVHAKTLHEYQNPRLINNGKDLDEIKNGYESFLTTMQNDNNLSGFTDESQEHGVKGNLEDDGILDREDDEKQERKEIIGEKLSHEKCDSEGNITDPNESNNGHVKKMDGDVVEVEEVANEDNNEEASSTKVGLYDNCDDTRSRESVAKQQMELSTPNPQKQLPIEYKSSDQDMASNDNQIEQVKVNENRNTEGNEPLNSLDEHEKNDNPDWNKPTDRNHHQLSPVNVYNGMTQSLPTQMVLTHPENSVNSTASSDSGSPQRKPKHDSKVDTVATSHPSQQLLDAKQASSMDQFDSNLDSLYGASTEVIKSPSGTKSQDSATSDKNSYTPNINSNHSKEDQIATSLQSQTQLSQAQKSELGNPSPNSSDNKNISSSDGHNNSSTTNDDSYYNADTLPLPTPTKSKKSSAESLKLTMSNDSKSLEHPVDPTVDDVPLQDIQQHLNMNESEETKTVIADFSESQASLCESNASNLDASKEQPSVEGGANNKLVNNEKRIQVDERQTTSNPSLLGPTPSQPDISLSYPNDYLGDLQNNCDKNGDKACNKASINSEVNADESSDLDSSVQCQEGTTGKQTKRESLVSKESANVKTAADPRNDEIVDSDEESGRQYIKTQKRNATTSFKFLPPSPGSRQQCKDTTNEHECDDSIGTNCRRSLDIENETETESNAMKAVIKSLPKDALKLQCGIDEIVEDFSQNIPNEKSKNIAPEFLKRDLASNPMTMKEDKKRKHENLTLSSHDIDEDTDFMSSLTDTQPEVEQINSHRKKLQRIKRGVKNFYPNDTENDLQHNDLKELTTHDNYEEEQEFEDLKNDEKEVEAEEMIHISQTDGDIKTKLHNLRQINVKELSKNLLQSPMICMKSAQQKIDSLSAENKELLKSSKRISQENTQLKHRLSTLSARLKEKTSLCNEMKNELDRIQPLIQLVQEMGNSSMKRTKASTRNTSESRKSSKVNKILNAKNDIEDEMTENDTPKKRLNFDTPKVQQRQRGNKSAVVSVSAKKRVKGTVTFKVLWRLLQKAGWKYKSGPEPYGSVYVPPNGSVRIGSVLGKDFFHADHQLWMKAEQMGIIDKESNQSESKKVDDFSCDENSVSSDEGDKINVRRTMKPAYISSPESCSSQRSELANKITTKPSQKQLDEEKLCGTSLALTENSIYKITKLISDFLTKNQESGNFNRDLWLPLWRCINNEQGFGREDLCWRYCKSIGAGKLGRDFWYSPPFSSLGAKGQMGKDYFTTEEAVVAFLLRDIKFAETNSASRYVLDEFEMKLSRAIQEHLPFDEIHLSPNGKTKRRGKRRNLSEFVPDIQKDSPSKRKRVQKETIEQKNVDQRNFSMEGHSQNTMEGAEILLELTKSIVGGGPVTQDRSCIATKLGIKRLKNFVMNGKVDTSPSISRSLASQKKSPKRGTNKNSLNVACHLTQAPEDLRLETWVSPIPDKRKQVLKTPLKGYHFFGSGIDINVVNTVTKLGGKFLKEIKGESLKRSNVVKKLFFLSGASNRRNLKYLLACALGVPMLHFEWIYALERKVAEFHSLREVEQSEKFQPTVFDANLYKAYRLPLGLSTETNLFVLQRASHAKKWKGLIGDSGTYIFTGLNILVVLENVEAEKIWMSILELAGATIVSCTDVEKEKLKVDIVLTDSLCLPPQVTAMVPRIAKVLNKVTLAENGQILDLSWATQCIVRKRRISIAEKFRIQNGNKACDRFIDIFSIKVEQFGNRTRYEVGDSIKFGKKKSNLSYGRITAIQFDTRRRRKMIEIRILELHNENELMDGGQSVSTIAIEENELRGHILILGGKDFEEVDWSNNEFVFVQKKASK